MLEQAIQNTKFYSPSFSSQILSSIKLEINDLCFRATQTQLNLKFLRILRPKLGKLVRKLELQLKKWMRLKLDGCNNSKFWSLPKLEFNEKWARSIFQAFWFLFLVGVLVSEMGSQLWKYFTIIKTQKNFFRGRDEFARPCSAPLLHASALSGLYLKLYGLPGLCVCMCWHAPPD